MGTSKETADYLLDQMRDLAAVRARKMFGEYAIYYEDKVVALVCDDQLFVKITPEGRSFLGDRYLEGEPYPGAKPYMVVDATDVEDSERLCHLIRLTASSLPPPKPKKPRSPRAR